MKIYLYLLIISFSLTACYTYRPISDSDKTPQNTKKEQVKSNEPKRSVVSNPQQLSVGSEAKDLQKNKTGKDKGKNADSKPTSIEGKLEPNKFYKIEAAGKSYKIQVDKWESDSLVVHVIHHPKIKLKFHKNQIDQKTIAERRFSQPTADIITVLAYAGIGVLIWAIVK